MITIRDLVENGSFDIDMPLYVVDPQDEDGAFPVALEYDLSVTITGQRQVVLLRVREDFDVRIIHD